MVIMLVDDSASIRKLAKDMLAAVGITGIMEAENGKVAMQLLKDKLPDVIITDWNMPEINGLTLVKMCRQLGLKQPIIMMTTESGKEQVVEAVKAGVNNYIVKPFTRDEFYKRLNETLVKFNLPVTTPPAAAAA